MNEYRFARTFLGKNRVFWCVLGEDWWRCGSLLAHGYETTVEEAEVKAKAVAGEGALRTSAYTAATIHRMLSAERRRERPAKASASYKVEYVYSYWDCSDTTYPGETWEPEATAYRVLKKTKTRIYVEWEPGLIEMIEQAVYQDHELRTFVLDRGEFEREGSARARSKGWWHGSFHATPEAAVRGHAHSNGSLPGTVSEAIARLGLDEQDIDEATIKKAYRRRSMAVHPDHGGDAGDFVRLQEDCQLIERHFGYGHA